MKFSRPAGIALLLALTAVAAGPVAKSALRIVVFSDDPQRARELLVKLAARGYSNRDNTVHPNPNREFNIKYGAAPFPYIEEIATYTEGRYDVELRRSREFDSTDTDVFINLPFATRAGTNADRARLRIVVLTEDVEQGEALLAVLAGLGYTNEDNCVDEAAPEDAELLYGSAAPAVIDELSEVVLEETDIELAPLRLFEPDDDDVFISLPAVDRPPARSRIRLTVFAVNQKAGAEALSLLAGLGYTNRLNEALGNPKATATISYGACPAEYIAEMQTALERHYRRRFVPVQEFGADRHKVFINIPKN